MRISDEFDAEFEYEYVSAASNKDVVFAQADGKL